MNPFSNYYQLLETPETATPQEIKSAYRRMMKRYHPDHNPSPDAETRARLINQAYRTLSDPRKRHAYDMWLSDQYRRQRQAAGAGFSAFAEGRTRYQPPPGTGQSRARYQPPPRSRAQSPPRPPKAEREARAKKRKAEIRNEALKIALLVALIALSIAGGVLWLARNHVAPDAHTTLQGRMLTELPQGLAGNPGVIRLDASHNWLTRLDGQIASLPLLARLDASHNRLHDITPEFYEAQTLTHLDLSHNHLMRLSPKIGALYGLLQLDLSNNQLREIPVEALASLSRLHYLDLSGNPLPPDQVAHLEGLRPDLKIVF